MEDEVLISALVNGYCEYLRVFNNEDLKTAHDGVGRSVEGLDTIENVFHRMFYPFRMDEYVFSLVKVCMWKLETPHDVVDALNDVFSKEYIDYIVRKADDHHDHIIEDVPSRIVGHLREALNDVGKIENEFYLNENSEKYRHDVNKIHNSIVSLMRKIENEGK